MTAPHPTDLVPLPAQPADTPWPTEEWPRADPPAAAGLDALVDELHGDTARYGTTYASLVVSRGRLVHERYGGALPHLDRPEEPVGAHTALLSWSMAKSVLHALVGIAVGDGLLALDGPASVEGWVGPDPRAQITLQQLLEMRDGLDFAEDYVDDRTSDVIEMLFGAGRDDVAAYAASRPLRHPPGTAFNYSSGTSNLVSRVLCDALGGDVDAVEAFMRERLFGPLGMRSASPRFDEAGTFVGSSYVYATAQDFARFGLLYLRDGVWEDRRILPAGWVDHGRLPRSVDPTDGRRYGAHWWVVGDDHGGFWASGYDGQSILCVPALDLLVVRLGRTPLELSDHLPAWRARVTDAFASAA